MSIDRLHDYYTQYSEPINERINTDVMSFFDCKGSPLNQSLCIFLKFFLVMFAAGLAPKLPDYALKWFELVPVRIVVLFLIAWTSSHDPALSILIALAFYATVNMINGKKAFEKFRQQGAIRV